MWQPCNSPDIPSSTHHPFHSSSGFLQLLFVLFIFGFAATLQAAAKFYIRLFHSLQIYFALNFFAEHMSEHLRFMQVFFYILAATYSIFDVLQCRVCVCVCECVCATLFMAS